MTIAVGKATRVVEQGSKAARAPALARAELLSKVARSRLEDELEKALERKPASEAKLAGALRALAPLSPHLRASMAEAAAVMLRRGSLGREVYAACMRAVAEGGDAQTASLVRTALSHDEAGGAPALAAAALCRDSSLAALLGKVAASRQSHVAFGAETARVVRLESNGAHLTSLAPMIKESHRISLCVELFVPLARAGVAPIAIAPALSVLRGAERHLGRWLVLADVASKAGDGAPLVEAKTKSSSGPSSSRGAWALVAWALEESLARHRRQAPPPPPDVRPTVELVARLSDRPSSDRDLGFLFRIAAANGAGARPMLDAVVKQAPLNDETGVRAAMFLARDHGRDDLRTAILQIATGARRDELRGIATAALWDVGARDEARALADELLTSKNVGNVAWASLVRAAALTGSSGDVASEMNYRWIQLGWLE